MSLFPCWVVCNWGRLIICIVGVANPLLVNNVSVCQEWLSLVDNLCQLSGVTFLIGYLVACS